jgi:AraC-like DNA-binding protein
MENADPPLLLSQRFDSSGMNSRDAFRGWQQAVAPVFDVVPIDGHGQFAAAYDTYHLGDILVGIGTFDATAFTRSRQKALSDGIDHVMVQVYTLGGYTGTLDDRPITVRRGDLVSLDMARETRTASVASTNITVMIPRDLLNVREVPHGHMSQGPRGSVLGGLMVDFLLSLRERLPTMPRSVGAAAANATLALYHAAMEPMEEMGDAAPPPFRDAQFQRARRLIETRIGDSRLDAEMLATALGLSRSTLYRLFEPYRGVASFVLDRRLAHARRALCDPQDTRHIGVLAGDFGFVDPSHFSRAFRRRFGITPVEQRRQGRNAPANAEMGDGFDLRPWIKDLA